MIPHFRRKLFAHLVHLLFPFLTLGAVVAVVVVVEEKF